MYEKDFSFSTHSTAVLLSLSLSLSIYLCLSRCGTFAVHLRDNRSIPPISPVRAVNLLAHLLKFVYEAIPR